MIRVAIVDDNSFLLNAVREKLSFFDEITVRFTAKNGIDLLGKLKQHKSVDLILMDIEMPEMNGIEATELVKNKYPQLKIIMLTVFDNDENIFRSIKAGADGYLLKEVSPAELERAIRETLAGGAIMTPSIALKTLQMFRNPIEFEAAPDDEAPKLSVREAEILEQLSKGLTYGEIAGNLVLSTGTVRKHIENIYRKLQAGNKLEAIRIARKNRLIP